jgi:hypothetical protein
VNERIAQKSIVEVETSVLPVLRPERRVSENLGECIGDLSPVEKTVIEREQDFGHQSEPMVSTGSQCAPGGVIAIRSVS